MKRERLEKELATIQERTLTIKLSNADLFRVCEKAWLHNITVAELVESYLNDLVSGIYTNGSDERHKANDYFERCWYAAGEPKNTFFQYLSECGNLQEYLENMETLKDIKQDIESYMKIKNPSRDEQNELEMLQGDYEEVRGYIERYYSEYKEQCETINEEPEPPEKAQENIKNRFDEYEKMKGENE